MGDASLTAEEASYNYGMGAMYTNWLNIIQVRQRQFVVDCVAGCWVLLWVVVVLLSLLFLLLLMLLLLL